MSSWNEELKGGVSFEGSGEARKGASAALVDGLIGAMRHAGATQELDRDELLALTSVGFKHYVYDVEDNPAHEPPRRTSMKGDLFSNYGIVEAFGQHTGWEVMELNFIGAGDLAKLLAYEFAAQRVVLTWAPAGESGLPQWRVLVGLDASPAKFEVSCVSLHGGEVQVIDVSARGGSIQGEGEEDLVNWCVVVRPGEVPAWGLTLAKRRELVCRWGVKHARSRKEFFHETRENYATGLRGYEVWMRDALSQRAQLTSGEERSRHEEALRRHLEDLCEGRGALARRLPVWGGDFEVESEGFEVAAREYGEVFVHLEQAVREEVMSDPCLDCVERAWQAEQRAVDALALALEKL